MILKHYTEIEYDYNAIKRYAGIKTRNTDFDNLILSCVNEVKGKLFYKVCYTKTVVVINGAAVDIGLFNTTSKAFAKFLKGCNTAYVFCATVGIEMDRLIQKYLKTDLSKALIMQAIGTERIESLCDKFCDDLKSEGLNLTTRFSPGYADLDLKYQKDILCALNAGKNIGITLNESLLMSPSKSVTAIVGSKNEA